MRRTCVVLSVFILTPSNGRLGLRVRELAQSILFVGFLSRSDYELSEAQIIHQQTRRSYSSERGSNSAYRRLHPCTMPNDEPHFGICLQEL